MKFLSLIFIFSTVVNAQQYNYNLENIRWAIANEFNITTNDVDVTCGENCYSSFNFKVKEKTFRCTSENAFNIEWAIASELGIHVEDVEVTCDKLNSRK